MKNEEVKAKDEELIEYNGEYKTAYEWSQEQRKLETAVRYKKDQANALKSAGDDLGRRETQAKINSLQSKYNDLTAKTGLQSTPERMSVSGYNKVKAVDNNYLISGDGNKSQVVQKATKIKATSTDTIETVQLYNGDSSSTKYSSFSTGKNIQDQLKTGDISGIIRVSKSTITSEPNSITEVINAKGGIDRNYYDNNGNQHKQISNHDHGNASKHSYGTNGEHAHDYIYNEKGYLVDRPMRELTVEERKENGDIL